MDSSEQARVFDDWLSSHQGLLFKVIRGYAFTSHDRDDLFQEILLRMWKSIPDFQSQCAPTTWLYRIALYTAIDWSKRVQRHGDRERPLTASESEFSLSPRASDPRLDWLYEQITKLDEIERSLTLLWLDGFSYAEMASMLGISESNVGVKLNRIKKTLSERSLESGF